ncbi:MAG TPA: ATP-grasp domain-containing protein [Gemmatimonadales bacterium]|nr:ATP-grasp domain-containing protein [Gemmatimonadales bacterium]
MAADVRVLVTGADQHQGLAIIRGLGKAGIPVIACGSRTRSIGFRSRFATEHYTYTSPRQNKADFIRDILAIMDRTKPGLLIPGVESSLVVLDENRAEVERRAPLAAADSAALAVAVDKDATVRLAIRLGVPAPITVCCSTRAEALDQARTLRFPVAIKPRGNALHGPTSHRLDFKVRYARSPAELAQFLDSLGDAAGVPLIQECIRGTGVCVSAVMDHGRPLVLFPYRRVREVPLSGGVSVVRQSIALDPRLQQYVTALLGALRWHGIAMVEFKHDEDSDSYTLMEINPRFQASTALSLDAGLNLPQLVAHLYGCAPAAPDVSQYQVGVRERWLEGDMMALYQHLMDGGSSASAANPLYRAPSRRGAILDFLKDFRPGVRYDEFKLYDWKPGLREAGVLGGLVAGWFGEGVRGGLRRLAGGRQR